jgi:hypothetical protein
MDLIVKMGGDLTELMCVLDPELEFDQHRMSFLDV